MAKHRAGAPPPAMPVAGSPPSPPPVSAAMAMISSARSNEPPPGTGVVSVGLHAGGAPFSNIHPYNQHHHHPLLHYSHLHANSFSNSSSGQGSSSTSASPSQPGTAAVSNNSSVASSFSAAHAHGNHRLLSLAGNSSSGVSGTNSPAAQSVMGDSVAPTSGTATPVASRPPPPGSVRFRFGSPISVITASPDMTMAGVAGRDVLKVLKVGENAIEEVVNLRAAKGAGAGGGGAGAAAFSCTDMKWGNAFYANLIVSSYSNGDVIVWDLNKGMQKQGRFPFRRKRLLNDPILPRTSSFGAYNIREPSLIPPSRKQPIPECIAGLDDQVDLRTKHPCRATFEGRAEGVRDVQFNPVRPNEFIAAFENGSIQKWDIRKPTEAERRLGGHSGQALTVDWNPDGQLVATAGRDKIIKVWDTSSESRRPRHHIQTSAHVARVRWRPSSVVGGAFANLGSQHVASSALLNDARVLVWDLARPFVPEWAVEEHDSLITDFLWISPTIMWSCSKDRYFLRQDLRHVGYSPQDNLPSSAAAWNVYGGVTVVTTLTAASPNSFSLMNSTPLQADPSADASSSVLSATTPGSIGGPLGSAPGISALGGLGTGGVSTTASAAASALGLVSSSSASVSSGSSTAPPGATGGLSAFISDVLNTPAAQQTRDRIANMVGGGASSSMSGASSVVQGLSGQGGSTVSLSSLAGSTSMPPAPQLPPRRPTTPTPPATTSLMAAVIGGAAASGIPSPVTSAVTSAPGAGGSGAASAFSGSGATSAESRSPVQGRKSGANTVAPSTTGETTTPSSGGGLLDVKSGTGPPAQRAAVFDTGTVDPDAFAHLAMVYSVGLKEKDLKIACEMNAGAAIACFQYETARTWRLIGSMCTTESSTADTVRNLSRLFKESFKTPAIATNEKMGRGYDQDNDLTPRVDLMGGRRSAGDSNDSSPTMESRQPPPQEPPITPYMLHDKQGSEDPTQVSRPGSITTASPAPHNNHYSESPVEGNDTASLRASQLIDAIAKSPLPHGPAPNPPTTTTPVTSAPNSTSSTPIPPAGPGGDESSSASPYSTPRMVSVVDGAGSGGRAAGVIATSAAGLGLSSVNGKRLGQGSSAPPSTGRLTPETSSTAKPSPRPPPKVPATPAAASETGTPSDDEDEDDYRIHHDYLRTARWGSRLAGGLLLGATKPSVIVRPQRPRHPSEAPETPAAKDGSKRNEPGWDPARRSENAPESTVSQTMDAILGREDEEDDDYDEVEDLKDPSGLRRLMGLGLAGVNGSRPPGFGVFGGSGLGLDLYGQQGPSGDSEDERTRQSQTGLGNGSSMRQPRRALSDPANAIFESLLMGANANASDVPITAGALRSSASFPLPLLGVGGGFGDNLNGIAGLVDGRLMPGFFADPLSKQVVDVVLPPLDWKSAVRELIVMKAEMGDVQLSCVAALMLRGLVEFSDELLEMWCWEYVELLNRFRLYLDATEIMVVSKVPSLEAKALDGLVKIAKSSLESARSVNFQSAASTFGATAACTEVIQIVFKSVLGYSIHMMAEDGDSEDLSRDDVAYLSEIEQPLHHEAKKPRYMKLCRDVLKEL
ncbi:SEA (Seh1-associated) complex subunit [Phlyctochytrium bullatum]|nr:SEA (Seh1-associated) complex subunit [Phlyctochytrium bullatum]